MKWFVNENLNKASFIMLSIFDDGSRIDLTLFPIENLNTDYHHDSLTTVWIDKDFPFSKYSTGIGQRLFCEKVLSTRVYRSM